MDMNVWSVILGALMALVVFGAVFALIYFSKGARKYDERQALARGRAYCAAFWTLVAYLCLNGILDSMFGAWGDFIVEAIAGICLGVIVFVVICIFTDAYFALNDKRSKYIGLFAFVAATNLFTVLVNVRSGLPFAENGLLNFHCLNIAVCIMFVILFVSLIIKGAIDKSAAKEE